MQMYKVDTLLAKYSTPMQRISLYADKLCLVLTESEYYSQPDNLAILPDLDAGWVPCVRIRA